jgi:hypothetical protein
VNGPDFARPSREHIAVLERASSASITSMLRRRDVHRIGIPLKPVVPGLNRVVGPALTLRSRGRPTPDTPTTLSRRSSPAT